MDWNFSNLIAGGAVVGVLAACWDKVRSLLWRLVNLVIQQVELSCASSHGAVIAHLVERYPRSRFYDRVFAASHERHCDGRYGLVPYEWFGDRSVVFWDGWRPFLFANARERRRRRNQSRSEESDDSSLKVYSTITFLRGTVDVESIVREACERNNQQAWALGADDEPAINRFCVVRSPARSDDDDDADSVTGLPWYRVASYRLLGHSPDDLGLGRQVNGPALDNLVFPQRVKDLVREVELWRASREWYRGRGIPWKRGWLLYGPPGTGKTALARAFAEDLNMPIYVYNLAEMSNQEMLKSWTAMQKNVPCVALLEDIDNVFHGRENIARQGPSQPFFAAPPRGDSDGDQQPKPFMPLTFDCLLNCLDGVERADGVFTVITTNDVSKIDPALGHPRSLADGTAEFISTRPGRIDKAIELGYMEPSDKKRLAQKIIDGFPVELRAMIEFIDRNTDLLETPAQFQERCAQVALAAFWRRAGEQRAAPAAPVPATVENDASVTRA